MPPPLGAGSPISWSSSPWHLVPMSQRPGADVIGSPHQGSRTFSQRSFEGWLLMKLKQARFFGAFSLLLGLVPTSALRACTLQLPTPPPARVLPNCTACLGWVLPSTSCFPLLSDCGSWSTPFPPWICLYVCFFFK